MVIFFTRNYLFYYLFIFHNILQPQVDEPLGSRQMFDNWGRGSNIKTSNMPTTTSSPNMFAALESIGNDTEKRSLEMRTGGSRSSSTRDPYNSKGPSLERSYNKQQPQQQQQQPHDRRGSSRSGSQHRSADNSQRSTPVSTNTTKQPPVPMYVAPPPAVELTPEKLEMKWKTILEEYVNECLNVNEFREEMKIFPVNDLDIYVVNGYVINLLFFYSRH